MFMYCREERWRKLLSRYQYCVIVIFTWYTWNAPTSARNVVHTTSASMCWPPPAADRIWGQLRLLFCYCSAFTKDGKNVSGCFNNSHRITQHYHFVVYKGATEGGIITNNLFPLSLCASTMCDSFISIQIWSWWIIYCVLGLFYMQIYFKSAGPFCARAALCSRMPELWRSRSWYGLRHPSRAQTKQTCLVFYRADVALIKQRRNKTPVLGNEFCRL